MQNQGLDHVSLYQAAFIGGLVLACVLEALAPARQAKSSVSLLRWFNNLALAAINYALIIAVTPLVYIGVAQVFDLQNFGLLRQFPLHPAIEFVVLFLAMEFALYWFHRASHTWGWLWSLHAVHHTDTQLDFSTAHRHHPLETLVSIVPAFAVVLLLGPDLAVLLAYNLLAVVLSALNHANMVWGKGLNRALKWIVVTPDFHRVHHSSERRYTNSHYGTISPLFDHLFGTATRLADGPEQDMPLGLEYLREPADSRIDQLLLQPLRIGAASRAQAHRTDEKAQAQAARAKAKGRSANA